MRNPFLEIAKALCVAQGGHRAGVLESSFVAEVKFDLMGEQTILCGMLQAGALLCYDKMTANDMPACDLVIVALKTTVNHVLKEILPQVIKENSTVLVLQNGLGADDDVAAIVGAEHVGGGLCFICSVKVGPGHIHHQDFGLITLGEYRADGSAVGITPRLKALGALLETAGISVRLEEYLLLARVSKVSTDLNPFPSPARKISILKLPLRCSAFVEPLLPILASFLYG